MRKQPAGKGAASAPEPLTNSSRPEPALEAFHAALVEARVLMDAFRSAPSDVVLLAAFLQIRAAARAHEALQDSERLFASRGALEALIRRIDTEMLIYAQREVAKDRKGAAEKAVGAIQVVRAMAEEYAEVHRQQQAWLAGKRSTPPNSGVASAVRARVARRLKVPLSRVWRAWSESHVLPDQAAVFGRRPGDGGPEITEPRQAVQAQDSNLVFVVELYHRRIAADTKKAATTKRATGLQRLEYSKKGRALK